MNPKILYVFQQVREDRIYCRDELVQPDERARPRRAEGGGRDTFLKDVRSTETVFQLHLAINYK